MRNVKSIFTPKKQHPVKTFRVLEMTLIKIHVCPILRIQTELWTHLRAFFSKLYYLFYFLSDMVVMMILGENPRQTQEGN
jgi:hypothetical protein